MNVIFEKNNVNISC